MGDITMNNIFVPEVILSYGNSDSSVSTSPARTSSDYLLTPESPDTNDEVDEEVDEPKSLLKHERYMIFEYLPPFSIPCRETECSVSRYLHEQHPLLTKHFSPYEHKIMIIYLVKKESVSKGKGIGIWKNLINDGFLTHRKFYSLNKTFRMKVLRKLDSFHLPPDVKKKFLALTTKK